MKGKIYIKPLKLEIPPYKPRDEFSTEKIINSHNAIARRKRLQFLLDESKEYPVEPFNILTMVEPAKRASLLKMCYYYMRYLLP